MYILWENTVQFVTPPSDVTCALTKAASVSKPARWWALSIPNQVLLLWKKMMSFNYLHTLAEVPYEPYTVCLCGCAHKWKCTWKVPLTVWYHSWPCLRLASPWYPAPWVQRVPGEPCGWPGDSIAYSHLQHDHQYDIWSILKAYQIYIWRTQDMADSLGDCFRFVYILKDVGCKLWQLILCLFFMFTNFVYHKICLITVLQKYFN